MPAKNNITPDFEAKTHTYTVCGIKKASVTQILKEFIRIEQFGDAYYVHVRSGVVIPETVMHRAGDFGTAIHKVSFHLLQGHTLNWETLHPSLLPVARRLSDWIIKHNPGIVLMEQPMYSAKYDYVGTPDIICTLPSVKHLNLIDIKTGGHEMVGPQVAAYEQLYREYSGYKGVINRWLLYLPKDGGEAVFTPLQRKDDMQYFLWKKAEHNWLHK